MLFGPQKAYLRVTLPTLTEQIRFVVQEEPLAGWKLKRTIDGQDKAEYTINKDYILKAGGKVKVALNATNTSVKN